MLTFITINAFVDWEGTEGTEEQCHGDPVHTKVAVKIITDTVF